MDYLALCPDGSAAAPDIAWEKAQIVYHAYLGWYERHKFIDIIDQDVETQEMMLIRHLDLFADELPKG